MGLQLLLHAARVETRTAAEVHLASGQVVARRRDQRESRNRPSAAAVVAASGRGGLAWLGSGIALGLDEP